MKTNRIASLVAVLALGIVLGGGATYFWLSRSDAFSRIARAGSDHTDAHGADEELHGDSERHDEHDANRDEGLIKLSPVELREFGIEVRSAGAGQVVRVLTLPGEIVLNADQVAHIVPRVGGIVKRVDKRLGDTVKLGEVMAVLESRELAEAKASYLAAAQRLGLARATFPSSEELVVKGILPELEFLAVRRERDEAEIGMRAAEHQLYALGLTRKETAGIAQEGDDVFSIYELRVPFAGTVIEKHITLGEVVTNESDVFELADLSTVWVNLTVYQKDLATVSVGQSVVISAGHGVPKASGMIEYVSPVIEEATRTAMARFVLPNPD
ncbi:MAG: efflux RND transporter periplasmic adaptor subunit, partial [Planctomycetes bacterium]|nr:efflux RND transporter periplasmic adaptor subunit [Planctomycetota bacterium]